MSLPLFTRDVGPKGITPYVPAVEPLAPYKAYAEGARIAKDVPSTGQAIVEGLQKAVEVSNKNRDAQQNAEIKQQAIQLGREQLTPEAIALRQQEMQVKQDEYARAIRIRQQEDALMNILQNGKPEQKVQAYWSGEFTEVFAARPTLQATMLDTVVAPASTMGELLTYKGKLINDTKNSLTPAKQFEIEKKEGELRRKLVTNPFYSKIVDTSNGLSLGEQITTLANAKPLAFNSIMTDTAGNVQYEDVGGKQVPKRREDIEEGLPPGVTSDMSRTHSTVLLGGKAYIFSNADIADAKASALELDSLVGAKDIIASTTDKHINGRNRQEFKDAVNKGIGTPPQQLQVNDPRTNQPVEPPSQPTKDITKGELVATKTVTPTGDIDPVKLKEQITPKLQLTPEQTNKYGDQLAALAKAEASGDILFNEDIGAVSLRSAPYMDVSLSGVKIKEAPAAGLSAIFEQIMQDNYNKYVAEQTELQKGRDTSLAARRAELSAAGIDESLAKPEKTNILRLDQYRPIETRRLIDRFFLLTRELKNAKLANSQEAINAEKAKRNKTLQELTNSSTTTN